MDFKFKDGDRNEGQLKNIGKGKCFEVPGFYGTSDGRNIYMRLDEPVNNNGRISFVGLAFGKLYSEMPAFTVIPVSVTCRVD